MLSDRLRIIVVIDRTSPHLIILPIVIIVLDAIDYFIAVLNNTVREICVTECSITIHRALNVVGAPC